MLAVQRDTGLQQDSGFEKFLEKQRKNPLSDVGFYEHTTVEANDQIRTRPIAQIQIIESESETFGENSIS